MNASTVPLDNVEESNIANCDDNVLVTVAVELAVEEGTTKGLVLDSTDSLDVSL